MRPIYAPLVIDSRGQTARTVALALASELVRECESHGAPWISFGDVARDDAGNPFTIDRNATCYITSSNPLPRALVFAEGARLYYGALNIVYSLTLPAYNAWHIARSAGLDRNDYGRTWWVYDSRESYLESLD